MAAQKSNPYASLWMLGLALTLPMIMLSGPVAGYFLSQVWIQHFDGPLFAGPVLMGLGLLGSGLQTYRLIQRLNRSSAAPQKNPE